MGIGLDQFKELLPGAVRASVIHNEDLVRPIEFGENGMKFVSQGRDVLHFVVDRNDD
jgi:hypothetical protein